MSEENGNDQLAGALAKARSQFEPIPKNRTVTVDTAKGSYSFSYATLDAILAAVMPALSAKGIAVLQTVEDEGGRLVLATHLVHESGDRHRVAVPFLMPNQGTQQALGSALTYARRYGLKLALCIESDEDDDGSAAEGNKITDAKQKGRGKKAVEKRDPQPAAAWGLRDYVARQFELLDAIHNLDPLLVSPDCLERVDAVGTMAREKLRSEWMNGEAFDKNNPKDWGKWIGVLEKVLDGATPPPVAS